MIRAMRRLYINFQLWRRGYCTKHLQKKCMDIAWSHYPYICRECAKEKNAKKQAERSEDDRKEAGWLEELRQD